MTVRNPPRFLFILDFEDFFAAASIKAVNSLKVHPFRISFRSVGGKKALSSSSVSLYTCFAVLELKLLALDRGLQ
jgi:hypothetical protein